MQKINVHGRRSNFVAPGRAGSSLSVRAVRSPICRAIRRSAVRNLHSVDRFCNRLDAHRFATHVLTAPAHALAQAVEHGHGLFPGDARVCTRGQHIGGGWEVLRGLTGDGLAVLEPCGTRDGDVLAALDEVGLEHDAHDHLRGVARLELFRLRAASAYALC